MPRHGKARRAMSYRDDNDGKPPRFSFNVCLSFSVCLNIPKRRQRGREEKHGYSAILITCINMV